MRYLSLYLLGTVGAAALYAGPVLIGSGVNGANGLTASYVTGATTSSCSGASLAQAGFTGCDATGASTFGAGGLKNYNTVLFDAANPNPAPTVATTSTTATVSDTLDGATTFAMIGGNSTGTQNYWATGTVSGIPASQITIPIGIFGIDKVWTMLNDYWGTYTGTGSSTEVDFYFNSSSSNGATGTTIIDQITLVNGVDIRSSIQCTNVTGAACPVQTTGGGGAFPANGAVTTTLTAGAGVTSGDAKVYANNVFSAGYTGVNSAGTLWTGTTGNVLLDAQAFDFGNTYTNSWLTKIVINNTSNSANFSRDALSAITVNVADVAQVPEPSTTLLCGIGLAAFGFINRSRRV